MNLHLPSQGEFRQSKCKKFEETLILVPFFGAKKSSLTRHIEFFNDLGYDVVFFDLKKGLKDTQGSVFSSDSGLGFKRIWADQIEGILNSISGSKIVYSFSNPSASAIEAISRRHATDIKGLICDSGPSADLYQSSINYLKHEEPIRLLPLRLAAAFVMALVWSPNYKETVHEDLKNIPEHFKILSIRGWKDHLISAQEIDQVFDPHSQIDWQRLSLPQAGHLNGLRDYKEEYAEPVRLFLKTISTSLQTSNKKPLAGRN